MKKRIEFFDLAKGLCIILVILHHVFGKQMPFSTQMTNIRMPLYFMLSGIFFKEYENFIGFAIRKINKLFIPFCFWYLFSITIPYIVFEFTENKIWGYTEASFLHTFVGLFTERHSCNVVIWFLLCLFWLNLYFYTIKIIASKISIKHETTLIAFFCIIVGLIGMTLGYYRFMIPGFFDNAMTALPFFATGYLIYRKTNLFQCDNHKYWIYLLLASVLGISIILLFGQPVFYLRNQITMQNIYLIWPFGIIGGLSMMILAKLIVRIPILTYFGRYSIIILCTHSIIIMSYNFLLMKTHNLGITFIPSNVLSLLLLLPSYFAIIPFCIKFLPHVTAQKDVFSIGK